MSDQNKALSKRNFEEVWNQRKLNVIDELVASNSVLHDPSVPGGKVNGSTGYKQFVEIYQTAFPDLHFTVNDQGLATRMITYARPRQPVFTLKPD